ncbi:MAG: hypothetical protein ABH854_05835 [Candidatus Diapherotrites archaeon]|nr:hypothetical protein [Candidatus Micrarchaeota archaeon]
MVKGWSLEGTGAGRLLKRRAWRNVQKTKVRMLVSRYFSREKPFMLHRRYSRLPAELRAYLEKNKCIIVHEGVVTLTKAVQKKVFGPGGG